MWLLPAFARVSSLAARIYYRLTVTGGPVPQQGSVLLVANHPNSLLDPVLVAAGAGRPVRFLAKAPLFSDRLIGWLIRGAGAIPVYRRIDDPGATRQNVDTFRAVFAELGRGAAIGLFPEGISHSEPSLTPLKTGAARIALGTWARIRTDAGAARMTPGVAGPFPIIPIGIVLRRKDTFRSPAAVMIGAPVVWKDLADRTDDDHDAVRELTKRIDDALRDVTVNLDRWEDEPLVRCAESVWRAEFGGESTPEPRITRLRITTAILADLRARPQPRWTTLVRDLRGHARRLQRLGLSPAALDTDTRLSGSVGWVARRLYLIGIPTILIATSSWIMFWVPYQVTRLLAGVAKPDLDQRSTHKLLIGIVLYGLWLALAVIVAVWLWGPWAGLFVIILMPAVGMVGLWIRERWRGAWKDIRRFFLLRSRREVVSELRADQRRLAAEFKALYATWQTNA
jgi:glycerol-3-phosphate O-acyltransferase / dihydroxyacetone phosphate acyltransferase